MDHMEGTVPVFESKIAANARVHARTHATPYRQSVDSKIVPVSSIAPEGWGAKEGGNATSPLHSRGSPTKGNKIRKQNLGQGSP